MFNHHNFTILSRYLPVLLIWGSSTPVFADYEADTPLSISGKIFNTDNSAQLCSGNSIVPVRVFEYLMFHAKIPILDDGAASAESKALLKALGAYERGETSKIDIDNLLKKHPKESRSIALGLIKWGYSTGYKQEHPFGIKAVSQSLSRRGLTDNSRSKTGWRDIRDTFIGLQQQYDIAVEKDQKQENDAERNKLARQVLMAFLKGEYAISCYDKVESAFKWPDSLMLRASKDDFFKSKDKAAGATLSFSHNTTVEDEETTDPATGDVIKTAYTKQDANFTFNGTLGFKAPALWDAKSFGYLRYYHEDKDTRKNGVNEEKQICGRTDPDVDPLPQNLSLCDSDKKQSFTVGYISRWENLLSDEGISLNLDGAYTFDQKHNSETFRTNVVGDFSTWIYDKFSVSNGWEFRKGYYFKLTPEAFLEYAYIVDAGDNEELQKIKEATNGGQRVDSSSHYIGVGGRLAAEVKMPLLTLSAKYRYLTIENLPDKDLLELGASYAPPNWKGFGLKASYTKGHDSDSFDELDKWTFGIEAKF